jgi:hypothetical protein
MVYGKPPDPAKQKCIEHTSALSGSVTGTRPAGQFSTDDRKDRGPARQIEKQNRVSAFERLFGNRERETVEDPALLAEDLPEQSRPFILW